MSEEAREALMAGVVNGACATPGCGHANGSHYATIAAPGGARCHADNCGCPRYAAPAAAPRVILSVHYHRTEPRVIVHAQRWSVDGVRQGAPLPVLALDRDTAQRFAEALRAAANGAGRQPLDPWVSIEGLGPLAAQLASSWGAVTDTMQAETMTGGVDAVDAS